MRVRVPPPAVLFGLKFAQECFDSLQATRIMKKLDDIAPGLHLCSKVQLTEVGNQSIIFALYALAACGACGACGYMMFDPCLTIVGYWSDEAVCHYLSAQLEYAAGGLKNARAFKMSRLLIPTAQHFFFFVHGHIVPRGYVSAAYLHLLTHQCELQALTHEFFYCWNILESPFCPSYVSLIRAFDASYTAHLHPRVYAYCEARWWQDSIWMYNCGLRDDVEDFLNCSDSFSFSDADDARSI